MPNSQASDGTMRKGRRRLKRACVYALSGVLCLVLIVPSLQALMVRLRVSSALRSASSVRLEEYVRGYFPRTNYVLTAAVLKGSQRSDVLSALPVRPDIGIPGLIARCFHPQHRVVIGDDTGEDLVLEVCFGCEEIRLSGSSVMMTPSLWQTSLRRLFIDHQIPIRDRRDYASIENATNRYSALP